MPTSFAYVRRIAGRVTHRHIAVRGASDELLAQAPTGNRPVTNVCNVGSSYWRAWMKPENRCLIMAISFSEYTSGKPAVPTWFALGTDRPLFAFAGLWRPWTGTHGTKADPVEGEHHLFAFLTCAPNAIVEPVHPKAMPVILTTPAECETWMTAPIAEALVLQRPLPDGLLEIVGRGEKQDPPVSTAKPVAGAQTSLL